MIKNLLVANRGEIACRIFRTASKMGIKTSALFSEVDENALHVKTADEAIYIGKAPASQSYLNIDKIITKALENGVDAIHPGYGFLSENSQFAKACAKHNILFIGPDSKAIEAMGSKAAAKAIMEDAQVPLIPGYHGANQQADYLLEQAQKMGFPVLIKASAGGGGKGMRVVWHSEEFLHALDAAKRESINSFSDDRVIIEKYLTEPRHIEIQVFCDKHQNGVYLFERDCSVQRRHQKIIEEAPAPNISEILRNEMGQAALKAAKAINYVGAGTVEFLLDKHGSFYFMEMNTRLQVEHPVTEFISGEDLVQWQLLVAMGHKLPKTQEQLQINGHSFEARIYAEDPENEFLPSTGTISYLREPAKSSYLRIDSGVVSGDKVSVYYDPMIAKLIVWGENREQALDTLLKGLRSYMICGISSNIQYLISIADNKAFRNAKLSTDFIERQKIHSPIPCLANLERNTLAALVCLIALDNEQDMTCRLSKINYLNFRLNSEHQVTIKFYLENLLCEALLTYHRNNTYSILANGEKIEFSAVKSTSTLSVLTDKKCEYPFFESETHASILTEAGQLDIKKDVFFKQDDADILSSGDIVAPMNGTITAIEVQVEQKVIKGDLLVVVEAMKMEHSLRAPFNGTVIACYGKLGSLVEGGYIIVSIETDQENHGDD